MIREREYEAKAYHKNPYESLRINSQYISANKQHSINDEVID